MTTASYQNQLIFGYLRRPLEFNKQGEVALDALHVSSSFGSENLRPDFADSNYICTATTLVLVPVALNKKIIIGNNKIK